MQNWKTSVVLSFFFVTWRCAVLSQCLQYDLCTLHESYRAVRSLSACGMICARCVNHTAAPSMIYARCVNHTQLKRHRQKLHCAIPTEHGSSQIAPNQCYVYRSECNTGGFNQVFSVRLNCRHSSSFMSS